MVRYFSRFAESLFSVLQNFFAFSLLLLDKSLTLHRNPQGKHTLLESKQTKRYARLAIGNLRNFLSIAREYDSSRV